ncbi:hypothetical protein [Treponema pedis]|uniref:Lipoprotein n=1 Tax=Treponema pedis TaxID=409322 RepID=A0A7S6WQD8_9SPIR|nr:hypothetical protein [Treponema pedis]QOW61380.1 hypothetical protein IFE08_03035 [Treponema pedis]
MTKCKLTTGLTLIVVLTIALTACPDTAFTKKIEEREYRQGWHKAEAKAFPTE